MVVAGKMADKGDLMEEDRDQSPSPGTPDSRKRPLDADADDAMSKKSHYIPGRILWPCIQIFILCVFIPCSKRSPVTKKHVKISLFGVCIDTTITYIIRATYAAV